MEIASNGNVCICMLLDECCIVCIWNQTIDWISACPVQVTLLSICVRLKWFRLTWLISKGLGFDNRLVQVL